MHSVQVPVLSGLLSNSSVECVVVKCCMGCDVDVVNTAAAASAAMAKADL